MILRPNRHLWKMALLALVLTTACEDEPDATAEAPAMADADTSDAMMEADTSAMTPPAMKLNLNTATGDDFRTIPGVGDRMVGEFEEYRPYVSIQQFRREIGKYVDEDQVAAYEAYVFVPVDPNDSDAETLQQLPGVDANEAAELIAGRPYASRAAFLEKLASYVAPDEQGIAEAYLTVE